MAKTFRQLEATMREMGMTYDPAVGRFVHPIPIETSPTNIHVTKRWFFATQEAADHFEAMWETNHEEALAWYRLGYLTRWMDDESDQLPKAPADA